MSNNYYSIFQLISDCFEQQNVACQINRRAENTFQATRAMHSGTLCKANMAAACARSLCKVGWSLLEFPVARRPGILSYPLGNINSHGFGRTYGTVRTVVRTKLLSNLRGGRGRFLGCAFLLGGGLGLYQAVKFSVYQHLAEEESKVSHSRK